MCLSCIVEKHLNVFFVGGRGFLGGPPNAQVHQIWSLLDSGAHYEFNRTQEWELKSGQKCHGSLVLACSYDYEDCECVCNVVFVVQTKWPESLENRYTLWVTGHTQEQVSYVYAIFVYRCIYIYMHDYIYIYIYTYVYFFYMQNIAKQPNPDKT